VVLISGVLSTQIATAAGSGNGRKITRPQWQMKRMLCEDPA
jgi:hypothetical protein